MTNRSIYEGVRRHSPERGPMTTIPNHPQPSIYEDVMVPLADGRNGYYTFREYEKFRDSPRWTVEACRDRVTEAMLDAGWTTRLLHRGENGGATSGLVMVPPHVAGGKVAERVSVPTDMTPYAKKTPAKKVPAKKVPAKKAPTPSDG